MTPEVIPAAITRYRMDDAALTALLDAARAAGAPAVLVHSRDVDFAAKTLANSDIAVIAAISYPSGANTEESRRTEMRRATESGAAGLFVVLPMGSFRDGERDRVARIVADARATAGQGLLVFCVESCLLDDTALIELTGLIGQDGLFCPTAGFEGADARPDAVQEYRRLCAVAGVSRVVPLLAAENAGAFAATGATASLVLAGVSTPAELAIFSAAVSAVGG